MCNCATSDDTVKRKTVPHSRKAKEKIATVMGEYKKGDLHSSSGDKVTSRQQATAIALSEARRGKKKA